MTVALLDIAPATEGHTLLVPRKHADDLLAASPEDAIATMRAAHVMARRLEETLCPDGITLFQANRPAGWQDIFHLHLHIVPRWKDDQLVRPWISTAQQDHSRLSRVADRVRMNR